MLGAASMVNKDQILDCLERGWVVVAPNHRLCPQLDLRQGPIEDIRDLLGWIQGGELDEVLEKHAASSHLGIDPDRILAFGTSAGAHLSLCLVSMFSESIRQY
jgi:acetyl esterase/lipase